MSEFAIRVENLSKQYRLGMVGTGTLKNDLNRLWHSIRGKEDPYLKVGTANDRTRKAESEYVWALRDVNFEVQQGEVLGIIGRNGAGKSTLLKILSKITAPTTGQALINGKIASLLEVGTGFHPELSGRENVFLNGSILGMRKREIQRKFDEIVDFSGVNAYIDTPVKRYSSGMYVRLAFAVAAFLNPEILIVDEVLAVGDSEFQKKCMDRMKSLSANEGKTILFVSHNLQAIKAMSQKGLYLKNGTVEFGGNISETIDYYVNSLYANESNRLNPEEDTLQLLDVSIGTSRSKTRAIAFGETLVVELKFKAPFSLQKPYFWISISGKNGSLFGANSLIDGLRPDRLDQEFTVRYCFPDLHLLPQEYVIHCGARSENAHTFLMTSMEVGSFNVVTSVQELGLNGPLAEQMAQDAVPLLVPYEVVFSNHAPMQFYPKLLCSKVS